jgi:PAS domain S-box-containing protein
MKRVLVVEDDAIISADIQSSLVRLGYDVPSTVDNGDDAVAQVEALHPDLVLMDIKLKGRDDGVHTAARIRRRSDVPVVYLTSHSDEATLARAKETTPHGYLVKPFNERDLRTAIEVAIRKGELEQHIARRERWFSTILESLGDAVIATDRSSAITYMNPVAEKMTGFPTGAATGRPLTDVFRLVDPSGALLESPVARAMRTRVAVKLAPETQLVDRSGAIHLVDDSASPIVDDRGELLGGVVVFRDVTERRDLERRLEMSQRLASLGTMAAGIAHEVNNPLAVVVGNVSFLMAEVRAARDELAADPNARSIAARLDSWLSSLVDASEGSDRVRKVVAAMRRLAGHGSSHSEVLDVSGILESAIKIAQNTIRQKARLVVVYGSTPLVEVDEGQMVQVFLNLLSNASDAIPEGDPRAHEVRVATRTDAAGCAVVEISDTGTGIAPEHLACIFDPFFSGKGVGNGMGLGLSLCHAFVATAGGELTVDSTLGQGSVFRVSLPPAGGERRSSEAPPSHAATTGRARVLVLDDEPAVVAVIARTLRDQDVVKETDPHAALSRIAAGERFDVFLCDLMMPTLSGVDVFESIRSANPELAAKMVFITGGALSPRTTAFLEKIGNRVLAKPFSSEALRDVVTKVAFGRRRPSQGSAPQSAGKPT